MASTIAILPSLYDAWGQEPILMRMIMFFQSPPGHYAIVPRVCEMERQTLMRQVAVRVIVTTTYDH